MTTNEKKSVCIILDQAHGVSVAGKHSPDKELREWKWSREICGRIQKQLIEEGYRVVFSSTGDDEPGLQNRVQCEHNYSNYFGRSKTVFLSIHVNAAGSDGQWKKASGFQAHVAVNASARSKELASLLYKQAEEHGLKVRRPKPHQDFWPNDFYVLKNTWCPAVLCESMFMDNKSDCEFMLSKDGKDTFVDIYCGALRDYVQNIIVK